MTIVAYQLDWDTIRLPEGATDLAFSVVPANVGFTGVRTPVVEDPIRAIGDASELEFIDFPANSRAWPVFSDRAWETLVGNETIAAQRFPIQVVDADSKKAINDVHLAVRFVEQFVDAFDREYSHFDEDEFEPSLVGFVEKLYFKVEAPPAIFRVREVPESLFVSPKARERAVAAGCTGFRWLPVEGRFLGDVGQGAKP